MVYPNSQGNFVCLPKSKTFVWMVDLQFLLINDDQNPQSESHQCPGTGCRERGFAASTTCSWTCCFKEQVNEHRFNFRLERLAVQGAPNIYLPVHHMGSLRKSGACPKIEPLGSFGH